MDEHENLVRIAGMVGDRTRARMLLGLMGGRALTATELALEADVAPSTASSHLARLREAELVVVRKQGRHRYFAIASPRVAELIEQLMVGAVGRGSRPVRTGSSDPAIRFARVCYDHLAGTLGVGLLGALLEQDHLAHQQGNLSVTPGGVRFFRTLEIDVDALRLLRRPVCRECLDWSQRRSHLAGSLGAALLAMVFERGWAERDLVSRAVRFDASGKRDFSRTFSIDRLPSPD